MSPLRAKNLRRHTRVAMYRPLVSLQQSAVSQLRSTPGASSTILTSCDLPQIKSQGKEAGKKSGLFGFLNQ